MEQWSRTAKSLERQGESVCHCRRECSGTYWRAVEHVLSVLMRAAGTREVGGRHRHEHCGTGPSAACA
jgi:hypothetical protein